MGLALFRQARLTAGKGRFPKRRLETAAVIIYEDLYLTEQPYGLVVGLLTGLPVSDSSSAALT